MIRVMRALLVLPLVALFLSAGPTRDANADVVPCAAKQAVSAPAGGWSAGRRPVVLVHAGPAGR